MIKTSDQALSYIKLLQTFPPRPIKSDEELLATQNVIDSLLDNTPLTLDEQDYLDLLGTLVYEYEQTKEPVPDIYGIELLKALMEEYGFHQKDLIPVFKTESRVLILNPLSHKTSCTKCVAYFYEKVLGTDVFGEIYGNTDNFLDNPSKNTQN